MKRIASVLLLGLLLSACRETTPVEPAESASSKAEDSQNLPGDEESESAEESSSSELTQEQKTYQEYESAFTDISLQDLQKKMDDKETALVYAGRVTCPYCVKFMPIFGEIAKEKNLKVYSLDTEVYPDFETFAPEHDIEYVPALMYLEGGELKNLPLKSPYPRADVEKALAEVGL